MTEWWKKLKKGDKLECISDSMGREGGKLYTIDAIYPEFETVYFVENVTHTWIDSDVSYHNHINRCFKFEDSSLLGGE